MSTRLETATVRPWATRRDWELDDVLPESLVAPPGAGPVASPEHEPRVFQDLVAEYDARLLEAELLTRGTRLSAPFLEFLSAWAADEEKHADALDRLYRGAFGADGDSLFSRLRARRGDFSSLASFLDDEFKLGVMLAYDEAMSTHGYGADVPFYESLGRSDAQSRAFARVLRELKSDEATHYKNAVELLTLRHRGRGGEVASVMEEIVALDAGQGEYRATFLLDHATDQFDATMMGRVGRAVTRTLERRLG
ncbi:MAG: hypothetical protein VX460_12030 [Planctomycetota bacterium]|nr:hypothetical protein [Planctomycetota bacterium]